MSRNSFVLLGVLVLAWWTIVIGAAAQRWPDALSVGGYDDYNALVQEAAAGCSGDPWYSKYPTFSPPASRGPEAPITVDEARAAGAQQDCRENSHAGRVLKALTATGLPIPVIEGHLETIERDIQQPGFNAYEYCRHSPLLAAWLESDELKALVAANAHALTQARWDAAWPAIAWAIFPPLVILPLAAVMVEKRAVIARRLPASLVTGGAALLAFGVASDLETRAVLMAIGAGGLSAGLLAVIARRGAGRQDHRTL